MCWSWGWTTVVWGWFDDFCWVCKDTWYVVWDLSTLLRRFPHRESNTRWSAEEKLKIVPTIARWMKMVLGSWHSVSNSIMIRLQYKLVQWIDSQVVNPFFNVGNRVFPWECVNPFTSCVKPLSITNSHRQSELAMGVLLAKVNQFMFGALKLMAVSVL